jgi:hypothetical protein
VVLFRVPGGLPHDPAVAAWLDACQGGLGELARTWFAELRACGEDVRETMHDGCPVALVEDVPFAYVNAFRVHVNVGFFLGAGLDDPGRLLEGTGKRMRHVKLRPAGDVDANALRALIRAAYEDVKVRLAAG